MDERSRHREFEDQFLSQLKARARQLVAGQLPARQVTVEALPDGDDSVRDQLARLEVFERDVLESMPGRQALQLCFRRPVFGGLYHTTVARVRAQSLVSVEMLVDDQVPGPVGREQVLDAMARYELLPHKHKPSAVVFASATGFTPEAKSLVEGDGPPTLILMGGRADGGWDVAMSERLRKSPWGKLFELETQDERLRRFMRHLDAQGLELDSRGLAVSRLAEQLGLPETKTEALVRQACRQDPRLMTVVHEGTIHICRSPLGSEGKPMSIWSRILRLFGRKPSASERVRVLTEQRVRLEQERSSIDKHVDTLETQERDLLQQGAQAPSDAEKKQIAAKLVRARRELKRHRTRAQMFNQQIDVLGTQIHHVTLTEQSKQVALPTSEELAQQAAEAEKVMTDLAASADLAGNIEVGASSPMMQEEEAAIFAEFEQVAKHGADAKSSTSADESAPEAGSSATDAQASGEAVPPPPNKDKTAKPEPG